MYPLQSIRFVLALSAITVAMLITPTIGDLKIASADSTKEQFLITVKNIGHKDVSVAVTIDGKTQRTNIDGNKKIIGQGTVQIVKFEFSKDGSDTPPTVLPLKLGDEYTVCIALKDSLSKTSCLRATLDSLTQPQSKTLDVKLIPN